MECGTETDLWPGGAKKEEKPPIEIPWTPVGIIGGGLLVLIVLLSVAWHLRVVPPGQVTQRWLDAVTARNVERAKEYTTPQFEATIMDRPASAEKADQYYQFIYNNDAAYAISAARYSPPDKPTAAVVTVTFTGNGQTLAQHVRLTRQGPKWLIVGVDD